MKRVLWVSRHQITPSQRKGLQDFLHEDVEVVADHQSFGDARDIVRRFKQSGCDELAVVAPLSVIAVLCQDGMKPLWSESAEENDPARIEYRGARGQGYRFVRFRRIVELRLIFEDELQ